MDHGACAIASFPSAIWVLRMWSAFSPSWRLVLEGATPGMAATWRRPFSFHFIVLIVRLTGFPCRFQVLSDGVDEPSPRLATAPVRTLIGVVIRPRARFFVKPLHRLEKLLAERGSEELIQHRPEETFREPLGPRTLDPHGAALDAVEHRIGLIRMMPPAATFPSTVRQMLGGTKPTAPTGVCRGLQIGPPRPLQASHAEGVSRLSNPPGRLHSTRRRSRR